MLVYDKDGIVHDKTPPDVRECVAVLGWSLTAPAKVEPLSEAIPAPSDESPVIDPAPEKRAYHRKAKEATE